MSIICCHIYHVLFYCKYSFMHDNFYPQLSTQKNITLNINYISIESFCCFHRVLFKFNTFPPRISFSVICWSIIHPYNNYWILNCDITNDMTSSRLQSILVLQPWIFQSSWNKDHCFITWKLFSKLSLLFNSTIILPEPCIFLYQRQRSTMATQTKLFNKKTPNRHLWSKFYKYESAFLQALLY